MEKKISTSRKNLYVIFLTIFLHLVGILVAFLEKKLDVPFNLNLHLLRLFTWWSVHSSILAILAAVMIIWERRKKTTSWMSQFINLQAAFFNLTTFLFVLSHLFLGVLEWKNSVVLNLQWVSWHLIAPVLTIYCFYSLASLDHLRKRYLRTFLCSFIYPTFYFFYVYILAKFNTRMTESKLVLYLKKYPYFVFEWIVEREKKQIFLAIFLALLAIFFLCSFLIWTKLLYEKNSKKKNIPS